MASTVNAQDGLCTWPYSNEEQDLRVLREGRIPIPPQFGIASPAWDGIAWDTFNTGHPSLRWYLNAMKYLRPLLQSGKEDDTNLASAILKEWHEQNRVGSPRSNFAWHAHATALRAEQLACLKARGKEEGWIDQAIITHGQMLSDPSQYEGKWNHGLDQDIGLLHLACATGNERWKAIAAERAAAAILAMADWQGVSIEQATDYHHYNYVRFKDAEKQFKACGKPLPEDIFGRLEKMPLFLAHATAPDGSWAVIGDTEQRELPEDLLTTEAGFAKSKGQQGIKPDNRFAAYYSGYVFGRSGWGEQTPFDQESYYTIRFGPARIIHGHNDHTALTYYTRGHHVLIDGGFSGYSDDKWRAHLRSPEAHNVVYTTDKANFFWNETTRLLDLAVHDGWQSYRLQDTPYFKTQRTRSVLMIQKPVEAIVVMDSLTGPSRRYEQAWHFDPALKVEKSGNGMIVSALDFAVEMHQLWPHDNIETMQGTEDPIRGWVGFGPLDLRPTPVVLTSRIASNATFLTLFAVRGKDETVEVSQRPIKDKDISREITIGISGSNVVVELLNNGVLRMAQKE